MTAWLIRTSSSSIEWSANSPNVVSIYSKRKPGFARYDYVALMSGRTSLAGDLVGIGEIKHIDKKEVDGASFRTTLFLAEFVTPTHGIDVDTLSFSLEFVRNLREPWRHFSRAYRRVSMFDIEVLSKGEVFWSRTAFLTFYMPLDAQQRFDIQRLSFETTGTALESLEFGMKWQVLEEYLYNELLSFLPLFEEIALTWHDLENESSIPKLDEVYFGTPLATAEENTQNKTFGLDSIGKQHKRFHGLDVLFGIKSQALHQNINLFNEVDQQIKESRSQSQLIFEERFKGRHDT